MDWIWVKTRQISRQRMNIHLGNKSNSSHTNEPSFQLCQWWIKNLLKILWDESGPQISAKIQYTQWRMCVKIFRPKDSRNRACKTQTESEQNRFSEKKKCPGFSSLYLLFVICLWTCLLSRVQTTHESTCVNFSTQFFNT